MFDYYVGWGLVKKIGMERTSPLFRLPLSLKIDNFSYGFDYGFDVVLCIKRTDTYPNRSSDLSGTQLFVHKRCAVEPGATGRAATRLIKEFCAPKGPPES